VRDIASNAALNEKMFVQSIFVTFKLKS